MSSARRPPLYFAGRTGAVTGALRAEERPDTGDSGVVSYAAAAGAGRAPIKLLRSVLSDRFFPLLVFVASLCIFLAAREHAFGEIGRRLPTIWDGDWYAGIATKGYWTDGNTVLQRNVVFFPLYPLTAATVSRLLGVGVPTGMFVTSCLSTVAMLFLLYGLLKHIQSRSVARLTIVFAALGPFSLFLYGGYSEPVFELLIAAFFYFLLVKKGYFEAAVYAGLASAARPHGALLGAILALELGRRYYRDHGLRVRLGSPWVMRALALGPLCISGLVVYSLYLDGSFGDPLAFSHGLEAWGGVSEAGADIKGLLTFRNLLGGLRSDLAIGDFGRPRLIGELLFAGAIAAMVFTARRLPVSMSAFGLLMLGLFHWLSQAGPAELVNLGRHVSAVLPVWAGLALVLAPERFRGLLIKAGLNDAGFARSLYFVPALIAIALSVVFYWHHTVLFWTGTFVS